LQPEIEQQIPAIMNMFIKIKFNGINYFKKWVSITFLSCHILERNVVAFGKYYNVSLI